MESTETPVSENAGCPCCAESSQSVNFKLAFQPIVSVSNQRVVAHEALARGPKGEPAATVLDQVTSENRLRFDQDCRTQAIESAAALGMTGSLSINFMPNAIAHPCDCIARMLETAKSCGFEMGKIILEVTETEQVDDLESLLAIFEEYRKYGVKTAIDDFGAGYAGLNLLARFQPDLVKIDIALVRGVDSNKVKQIIIESIVGMCARLGIAVLAEGVETAAERDYLRDLGVDLMQGFLFAPPAFQSLAVVEPQCFSA